MTSDFGLYIFPAVPPWGLKSVIVFPRVSISSERDSFANRDIIGSLAALTALLRNLTFTISSLSRMRRSSAIVPSVTRFLPIVSRGRMVEASLLNSCLLSGIRSPYMTAPLSACPQLQSLSSGILGMTSASSSLTFPMFSIMVRTTSLPSTTLPVIQQS